jgi:RNA polymerase sigma-70 factor (ECF subfamily)
LFRRARQGDRQAFGLLLRRYDPRLRRLAARLIAEPERVDPVLSRAYLRAWRSVPIVVPPVSVAEWLYRIVYNACINEVRWAADGAPPPPLDGPRVPLPLAPAERRVVGLRALAPEERVPLVLVDGEGFSLDATARILGRSERETAADLTRARYRWRSLVSGDPSPPPDEMVVELPPDPEVLPPLAELAEVAETTELGGHVRVVKPNGDDPDAEFPEPTPKRKDPWPRRRARRAPEPAAATASPPDDAREN